MKADIKVEAEIANFVAKIQDEINKHYSQNLSNLTTPQIVLNSGSKFYKLVQVNTDGNHISRSVHCFVDKQNGDIYKAATWAQPAKHVRGSIFDPNYGWGTAVGLYGATYLC